MTGATDPRPQRALRVAAGIAIATAASYGMELSLPFIAPILTLMLLVMRQEPLPLSAIVGLPLLVMLTTSCGLLLIPLLQYAPASGVLLVGLALFLCFRHMLRGANRLPAMFLIVGMTLISAAGASSYAIAEMVIESLTKGLLLAGSIVALSHRLLPDSAGVRPAAPAPVATEVDVDWIALRASLVVLPSFLLALTDPAAYMPLIMKSVTLGQQVSVTTARHAAREVLGATLLGGLLAMAFWSVLTVFPHLWMFSLWTLLVGLAVARKMFGLNHTRLPPELWLNALVTMILLLGQSVQDSAAGKDVYKAFAVRMALFIAVTLYACAMVFLIDKRREVTRRLPGRPG